MRFFKTVILIGILIALPLLGCSSTNKSNTNLPEPAVLPTPDFKPPQLQSWVTSNGITVLYLENNELPLVQGALYLRAGSLWEPANLSGALSAMGLQMSQGGAGKYDADEFDRELERLSARISSSIGGEYGQVSFSCLSADLEKIFGLFGDVVQRPLFDKQRINLWKGLALEGIRRRSDDPGTIAQLSFQELLYPDSVYGRVLMEKDIQRINRALLISLHKQYVYPDRAIFTVSGKVSRPEIERLLEKNFAEWKPHGITAQAPPPLKESKSPGIYFIKQPFEQATIFIGHLGVPRLTSDYIAISAFNQLFGSGSFSSRLLRRVRSELGLAYGVFGGISPGVVKGINSISLQTKAASAGEAIMESLKTLKQLQEQVVSDAELDNVKSAVESSFVFRYDTPNEVVARQALLRLLSYPPDYDDTFIPLTMQLTPAQVQEVAKKRWDSSRFIIVVVGNERAYNSIKAVLPNADKIVIARFDKKLILP